MQIGQWAPVGLRGCWDSSKGGRVDFRAEYSSDTDKGPQQSGARKEDGGFEYRPREREADRKGRWDPAVECPADVWLASHFTCPVHIGVSMCPPTTAMQYLQLFRPQTLDLSPRFSSMPCLILHGILLTLHSK